MSVPRVQEHIVVNQPSPGVAAVLSFIVPGLGQIYKQQIGVGIIWLLTVSVGYLACILPGLIAHLFCIYDASLDRSYSY